MRLALAIGIQLALVGLSRAQADSADATARAKALYEAGVRQYNLGEFEKALDDFKAAYELRPDPALLFNIGQSHRVLGHTQAAIFAYRAYLRELPDASNRDEVERLRAELEREQARHNVEASPAPEAASSPAPPPVAAPAVAETPAAAEKPAAVATPAVAPPVATAVPRTPLYKRWWLWTAVAAVAVVAVGVGVGVGVGAAAKDAPNPGGTAGSMVVHF
jgi:tetratricopeptide (TPR) repeat protein